MFDQSTPNQPNTPISNSSGPALPNATAPPLFKPKTSTPTPDSTAPVAPAKEPEDIFGGSDNAAPWYSREAIFHFILH